MLVSDASAGFEVVPVSVAGLELIDNAKVIKYDVVERSGITGYADYLTSTKGARDTSKVISVALVNRGFSPNGISYQLSDHITQGHLSARLFSITVAVDDL
jgi:hypothetical protein